MGPSVSNFLRALLLSALLVAAPVAGSTAAGEGRQFSDEERVELEKIIREYLLQNPEIIREVAAELQRREKIAAEAEAKEAIAANRDRLFDDGVSVVIGNPEGAVTLVEFYDYQCPYCRRMHKDILRLAEEEEDLRIVLKQFPIKDIPGEFPASLLAAMMAISADRQGHFEAFHKNAFAAAAEGKLSRERLFEVAAESGLDLFRLREDIDNGVYLDSIQDNLRLAREIGIGGTPAYVVGDSLIVGARGYDVLKAAIDERREALTAAN